MNTLSKSAASAASFESESICWLHLPEMSLYLADGFVKGSRYYMNYTAVKNDKVLFSGNDFSPSPLFSPRSLESIISCLSFLAVQPGDTDPDYFKNYNEDQMNWAQSHECEQLNGRISDFEDVGSEYQADAQRYFEANYYQNRA